VQLLRAEGFTVIITHSGRKIAVLECRCNYDVTMALWLMQRR